MTITASMRADSRRGRRASGSPAGLVRSTSTMERPLSQTRRFSAPVGGADLSLLRSGEASGRAPARPQRRSDLVLVGLLQGHEPGGGGGVEPQARRYNPDRTSVFSWSVGAVRRMGWFMGSHLGPAAMRCGYEPVWGAGFSPQGRRFADARCCGLKSALPSRFMGSRLFLFELPSAHEPKAPVNRRTPKASPRRTRSTSRSVWSACASAPLSLSRFMGSAADRTSAARADSAVGGAAGPATCAPVRGGWHEGDPYEPGT